MLAFNPRRVRRGLASAHALPFNEASRVTVSSQDIMTHDNSPYKSRGGLGRLINALRYSRQGFAAAFRHEAAFRQELLLCVVLVPLAFLIGQSLSETLVLIAVLFFVLIVELLNSALEALADSTTLEHRPLIGQAKDLGSAAVMLSIVCAVIVWIAIIVRGITL